MSGVGVVLRPELPAEEIVVAAKAADAAGVSELWLWEDCFLSGGISMAATVLASTEHVKVGIGVLPTPLRNVALTAMEISALARVHPGRLRVGIGHGVQDWMGRIGGRVQSPMTLLREQISALTHLLAGDTVDVQGRYVQLSNVTLDWPPLVPPPLLIGATGPKTLALSGGTSSGTILTSETSPDGVREAIGHIAGGPDHDVVVYITGETVVGNAEETADALVPWIEAGATTLVLEPGPEAHDLSHYFDVAATLSPRR